MNQQDIECVEGSCCEGGRRPVVPFSERKEAKAFKQNGFVHQPDGQCRVMPVDLDAIMPVEIDSDSPIAERGQDYGPPEINLTCIAKMWQAYLDNREPGRPLDLHDVCYMNSLQKLSRLARTPKHKDSLRDLSRGYLEIAEQQE